MSPPPQILPVKTSILQKNTTKTKPTRKKKVGKQIEISLLAFQTQ